MNKPKQRGFEVHIVLGTHWDREWRLSFEDTRQRLLETLQRTMNTLEKDPRVDSFTMDGQVMPVDDYLELRPQDRRRVEKLVRQGRLVVGPWYSLPEMGPLMGESIVRNLFHGITTARAYGKSLLHGLTNSSWGQISQMPQICKGFGIDVYYTYHGVPAHRYPVEFWWEGPDGSRVLFIRPTDASRAAFGVIELKARAPDPELFDQTDPTNPLMANAYRLADDARVHTTPFWGDDIDSPIDYDVLYKVYREARDIVAEQVVTPYVLLTEMCDQQNTPPDVADMVEEIARRDETGDRIKITSIEEYFNKVKKYCGKLKLRTFKGEMRFPAKESGIFRLAPTLSTRIYLKQQNRRAEHLLTRWTEPFAAFAWMAGRPYPEDTLWHAWRQMLVNHGHDNIGGCSIDIVHDDMLWRHRQIVEIGRAVLHRSLGHLTQQIGSAPVAPHESRVVVFNPSSFSRSEVVEAHLDLAPDKADEGLHAVDAAGEPVPCQVVSVSAEKTTTAELPLAVCPYMNTRRARVLIQVADVPAMGYAEYRVAPGKAPQPVKSQLTFGRNQMENEHLKVTVRANGTLDVLDKNTGELFKGLHYFADNGQDRGVNSPWSYSGPKHDKVFSTRRGKARVTRVLAGPLSVQLAVKYNFRIPRSLDMARGMIRREWVFNVHTSERRSPDLITIPITSVFTLSAGSRRIDVQTTVTNEALDHRLRVMFPSDVETGFSWSDTAYDVVRRKVARLERDHWLENAGGSPMTAYPMLSFADASSFGRSLAVLVDGLPEYELVEDARRTLAVTLLRTCTHRYSDPDVPAPKIHGAQCQGTYSFRYAICPHRGKWDRDGVLAEADRHNIPLKPVQSYGPGDGRLPDRNGFIEFDRDGLTVTAVKKAHEGSDLIVRLFNPKTKTVKTCMTCGFRVDKATLANMLEEPLPRAGLTVRRGRTIALSVGPKKILTLRLQVSR